MKRLFVLLLAAFIVLPVSNCFSAQEQPLTNLDFAEFLVQQLGIDVPAGAKTASKEGQYSTLVNALAAAGITYFQNTHYNSQISFANVVEVVYNVVGGKEGLNIAQKEEFLTRNGFLTQSMGGGSTVTISQLRNIFSVPALSGLIAEAYAEPEAGEVTMPGDNAPGAAAELPSSTI